MYLASVAVGMGLAHAPVWVACSRPWSWGIVRSDQCVSRRSSRPPSLHRDTGHALRGPRCGTVFLVDACIVYASRAVADFGREVVWGIPVPLWVAGAAVAVGGLLLNRTAFGAYLRSIGADAEGARRAGVPTQIITWSVYALCGAFAGLGGFISLSQTSAASGAFGQNAEFLAIAAAVLGGTSLFPEASRPHSLGARDRGSTHHDRAERARDDQCQSLCIPRHHRCGNLSRCTSR